MRVSHALKRELSGADITGTYRSSNFYQIRKFVDLHVIPGVSIHQERAITEVSNPLINAHRLSDDILREIFLLSTGDDLQFYAPYSEPKSKPRMPQQVALSRVCSRGRHLTLSMRILWSGVFFELFATWSKQPASKWLSKAGDYPAAIDIHSVNSPDDDLRSFLCAHNIRTLKISCYSTAGSQVARILDKLPDKNVSHLESLTLDLHPCRSWTTPATHVSTS
jgi:hypothetical protein